MVTAGDFRKGVTFEKDGQPCLVVDFQHVKPGKKLLIQVINSQKL